MSRQLATVPHAPIVRVNHDTGVKESLPIGSYCNVGASTGIFPRVAETGAEIVVQLPKVDWIFSVSSDAEAVEYARQLTHLANR